METRYEIMDRVGKSENSEVYKAYDRHLNRYVAIKKIYREEGYLFREAEILMKLKHPAIPVIYDVCKEEDNRCIIMEYMEGRNLLTLLEEEESMEEEIVVRIGISIAECLQYLHSLPSKMIYRDLKPSNILIDETGKVKLIDFDSAFMENEREGKKIRTGTYGYSAPEQFEGKQDIDEKSDIYGLGTTLYHLLTGCDPSRPPYHFYKIREINPLVSEELEKVVETCMAEEKEKRYGNMEEVLGELKRCEKMPRKRRRMYGGQKRRYMVEQKKNVLLTSKAGGGLFTMIIFICILLFFSGFTYGRGQGGKIPETIYAKGTDEILPLITYNAKREKIIIKNGAFYETDQDFHMALPKECLGEKGVEVTVICKELESGTKRERVLLLKEKKP